MGFSNGGGFVQKGSMAAALQGSQGPPGPAGPPGPTGPAGSGAANIAIQGPNTTYNEDLFGVGPIISYSASQAQQSQNAWAYGFVAPIDLTCSHVVTYTGGPAVASGVTSAYIAVYSLAANGDMTQIGITANLGSSMWTSTNTRYVSPFTASFNFVAGNAYAWVPYINATNACVLLSMNSPWAGLPLSIIGVNFYTQPFWSARTPGSASPPAASYTFTSLLSAAEAMAYAEFTT